MVIVFDLFAHATLFVYEVVAAHAEKAEPDDLQDDLVNLADDLTRFLLGMPGNFPDRLFLYAAGYPQRAPRLGDFSTEKVDEPVDNRARRSARR